MEEPKVVCDGEEAKALYESLSENEGYYYCSKCGRALDDHALPTQH